mgnify:FL=1
MLCDTGPISPSGLKSGPVVAAWQRDFSNLRVVPPIPALEREIAIAHDPEYVVGVLSGIIDNGCGNNNYEISKALPHIIGSMVDAAKWAMGHGIAVSPTSGFHHAGYVRGAGFCTFNGLIVAALIAAPGKRVLILDGDAHYGDGTDDIIRKLKLTNITNVTRRGKDAPWSSASEMIGRFEPELILYQASADAHNGDPLGAGYLSKTQMDRRDFEVFRAAKSKCIPIVWNLAGGYKKDKEGTFAPVIALHQRTMAACQEVYS